MSSYLVFFFSNLVWGRSSRVTIEFVQFRRVLMTDVLSR